MGRNEDAHNKGQSDRSEGKKSREPYGVMNRLTSSRKEEDRMEEANKAYKDGYDHTNKQKK